MKTYILHFYMDVRELVYWTDLWQKLSPPFVSKFHAVSVSPQFYCFIFLLPLLDSPRRLVLT